MSKYKVESNDILSIIQSVVSYSIGVIAGGFGAIFVVAMVIANHRIAPTIVYTLIILGAGAIVAGLVMSVYEDK